MKKLFLSLIVALVSLVPLTAALPGLTVLLPAGGKTNSAGAQDVRLDFNSQHYGRLLVELSSSVPGNTRIMLSPCYGEESEYCQNYYVGVDSPSGFSSYYGRLPSDLRPGKYKVSMSVVDSYGNVLASDVSESDLTIIPEPAAFTVFGKGQDNPVIWRVGSTQTVSFATYGLYDYGYLTLYTVGMGNGYSLSSIYISENGFLNDTFVVRPWVQSGNYVVIGTGQSSYTGNYFAGDSDLYVKVISSVITPAEDQVVVAGKPLKATWMGNRHVGHNKYAVTLNGSKLTNGPVFLNVASTLRGKVNVRIPKWVPPSDDYYLEFSASGLQGFKSDRFAVVKEKGDPITHVPTSPSNGGGSGVGIAIVGKN